MTIFRRCRVPLALAMTSIVLLVTGFLWKENYHSALYSSIVRDGRANAVAVVDRRDKEHLDSVSGIIPSAFFAVQTMGVDDGDPPQKVEVSSKEEGARPKLEAVLSEPEQEFNLNENRPLLQDLAQTTRKSSQLHQHLDDADHPIPSTDTRPPPTSPSPRPPLSSSPQTASPTLPSFHPSKELFVRAVHFDDRPRDGHHNTSVFLVVAIRNITDHDWIVGCQIDNHVAKDFKVALIGETPLWRAFYNHINHEEVMVHCFDLPATDKSTGYISFKTSANSTIKMAASEQHVKFPSPRIPPTSKEGKKYDLTIVACAKIFNSPPWLGDWITYQRTIGVDHIHFDAEDSFQKYGAINNRDIQVAILSGYVSVEIWKQYLNGNELWYHNQGLIYEDCTYRFRNTYDYIVMVDTDDFFTPRVPGEGKLHYYIDKYCRGKTTGSCKFKWIEFFPDHYGFNNKTVRDGNVTRRLANYSHYNQGNPKSLHRTNVVIDAATHYAYKMIDGYHIEKVSPNVAYFAHIRKKKDPPSVAKGLKIGIPHSSACLEHVVSRSLLVLLLMFCFLCRS